MKKLYTLCNNLFLRYKHLAIAALILLAGAVVAVSLPAVTVAQDSNLEDELVIKDEDAEDPPQPPIPPECLSPTFAVPVYVEQLESAPKLPKDKAIEFSEHRSDTVQIGLFRYNVEVHYIYYPEERYYIKEGETNMDRVYTYQGYQYAVNASQWYENIPVSRCVSGTYRSTCYKLVPSKETVDRCSTALQACWKPYFSGEGSPDCPVPTDEQQKEIKENPIENEDEEVVVDKYGEIGPDDSWSRSLFAHPFGGRVREAVPCLCSGTWKVKVEEPGINFGWYTYIPGMGQFANYRLPFPSFWVIGLYTEQYACVQWTGDNCRLEPTRGIITPIVGTSVF